jgi:hypothetical protein
MKFLKWLGITIGVIVIVVVLVLGYLGFVPGVSNVFGSNKPKNLGATYTAADYTSAHARNGTTHTILPAGTAPENSIKFSGQHPVNTTYTQAEMNALINSRRWEYYPLKDCQLRINPDNTVEFSGIVITNRIKGYLTALKLSENNMKSVTDYLKYIPGNPAFYVKGTLEVANGQIINTQVTQFKVGNLTFTKQIQDKLPEIINAAYSHIRSYPGFTIKTLKFINGQVQFIGTLPDSAVTISSK